MVEEFKIIGNPVRPIFAEKDGKIGRFFIGSA